MQYVKFIFLLPLFAFICQIYYYAITRQREEKQGICRGLGIMLFSLGVASLVSRDYFIVFAGLILMMSGFRLIAHGLDRLDKTIYIDSYNDSPPD